MIRLTEVGRDFVFGLFVLILGGGVEPEMHYPQWRRLHQQVERCNVLHESLIKLIEGTLLFSAFYLLHQNEERKRLIGM